MPAPTPSIHSLATVLDGWQGYETSIEHAIQDLTPEQLRWRPAPELRSVGELVRHIALGRLIWFLRMDAPGSAALAARIEGWQVDRDGNRYFEEDAVVGAEELAPLLGWLRDSWAMIEETLRAWTVEDLAVSYRHVWNGDAYANSRQWTLWRILSHDLHHGGELSLMLGLLGAPAFELGDLFGHIVLPPLAEDEG